MYSTLEVGFIALIALLAGVAVGYLVLRYLSPRSAARRPDEQLRQLREEQQHYRQQVTDHFNKTAEMLGQLASSYRDVHNHLASGAHALCDEPAIRALGTLPDDDTAPATNATTLEPPRDYAVKNSPLEAGALDERFGLERKAPPVTEPPRY